MDIQLQEFLSVTPGPIPLMPYQIVFKSTV